MASLQDLKQKIMSGVTLSDAERTDFLTQIDTGLRQLKEQDPEQYLRFIQEITSTLAEINKEMDGASAPVQ